MFERVDFAKADAVFDAVGPRRGDAFGAQVIGAKRGQIWGHGSAFVSGVATAICVHRQRHMQGLMRAL